MSRALWVPLGASTVVGASRGAPSAGRRRRTPPWAACGNVFLVVGGETDPRLTARISEVVDCGKGANVGVVAAGAATRSFSCADREWRAAPCASRMKKQRGAGAPLCFSSPEELDQLVRLSLSTIVTVASEGLPSAAPVGFERPTRNVSSASLSLSSTIVTVIVFDVSPAANETVPLFDW